MKRIYHPYNLWEDYKSGQYKTNYNYDEKKEAELAFKAKDLLSNQKEFYETAIQVITNWKYATEFNLSNNGLNRQAWLGQAACCYKFGIPEYLTKYGWRLMSLTEQTEANKTADKIIALWEAKQNAQNLFD